MWCQDTYFSGAGAPPKWLQQCMPCSVCVSVKIAFWMLAATWHANLPLKIVSWCHGLCSITIIYSASQFKNCLFLVLDNISIASSEGMSGIKPFATCSCSSSLSSILCVMNTKIEFQSHSVIFCDLWHQCWWRGKAKIANLAENHMVNLLLHEIDACFWDLQHWCEAEAQ